MSEILQKHICSALLTDLHGISNPLEKDVSTSQTGPKKIINSKGVKCSETYAKQIQVLFLYFLTIHLEFSENYCDIFFRFLLSKVKVKLIVVTGDSGGAWYEHLPPSGAFNPPPPQPNTNPPPPSRQHPPNINMETLQHVRNLCRETFSKSF